MNFFLLLKSTKIWVSIAPPQPTNKPTWSGHLMLLTCHYYTHIYVVYTCAFALQARRYTDTAHKCTTRTCACQVRAHICSHLCPTMTWNRRPRPGAARIQKNKNNLGTHYYMDCFMFTTCRWCVCRPCHLIPHAQPPLYKSNVRKILRDREWFFRIQGAQGLQQHGAAIRYRGWDWIISVGSWGQLEQRLIATSCLNM